MFWKFIFCIKWTSLVVREKKVETYGSLKKTNDENERKKEKRRGTRDIVHTREPVYFHSKNKVKKRRNNKIRAEKEREREQECKTEKKREKEREEVKGKGKRRKKTIAKLLAVPSRFHAVSTRRTRASASISTSASADANACVRVLPSGLRVPTRLSSIMQLMS